MGINKDQIKGRGEETKGKLKQVFGKLVGNETLEAEGIIQKNLGAAQAEMGDAKEKIADLTRKL